MEVKYHTLKLRSGTEDGIIEIRQGSAVKLMETEPYKRDAYKMMKFLENHLSSGTFDAMCHEAKRRLFR